MSVSLASLTTRAGQAVGRLRALRRSPRARRAGWFAGVALAVYALVGFFAVPALLHRWVDAHAGRLLGRPVSIGALRFNPFTLELAADDVHVGGADGKAPFVDIERLVLNLSSASLLRRAPVLDEVVMTHPRVVLVREADGRFNFSDLTERISAPSAAAASAEPTRFSLSNIRVLRGEIHFDDPARRASHRFEDIEIGIPFLANLPRDADVFVQPLLAMRIDGRPLRIEGRAKPFKDSLESTIDIALDRLDLPQYLPYAPVELPVAIPRGILSGSVRAHFVQDKTPRLRLDGVVVLDDVAVAEKGGAPIAETGRAIVSFADVQPLIARYRFGNVNLDRPALRYAARAGGRSNFDALLGTPKPAAAKAPAAEVAIANLGLVDGRFDYIDETRGDAPATLAIEAISGSATGIDTRAGAAAAAVDATARHNGGSLVTRGKLDLPASRYAGTLNAKGVGMAPMQPFVAPPRGGLAIRQGSADTQGSFVADWKGAFNLRIGPATTRLRDVVLSARGNEEPLIAWKTLDLALTKFDLAAAEARHGDVVLHGLSVKAQRGRDGNIHLAGLGAEAAAAADARPGAAAAAWKWSIARLVLDDARVHLEDAAAAGPAAVAIESIAGDISGLSDDRKQPLGLALSGSIGKGGFELKGDVRPEPLEVDVGVRTRELDVAGFQPYVDAPLNVRVTQAFLTSDGVLRYADGGPAKLTYRGHVALSRVRVKDKLSGDDFLSFRALDIGALDYAQGAGPAQTRLGDVVLSDFYARVIMNPSGRLNLADVAGSAAARPVSVTRAEGAANPAPAPQPAAAAPPPDRDAPAASLRVGPITLSRGHLNFTDNFIKPNYTANITQLSGKIGAFATAGGSPATVTLRGLLDDNAQVDIDGSIDPLAPAAFVDIKGKAKDVELTHLSAYSAKYTGYPIVKGRLDADVRYVLDRGKLTADNHLNIDQLTFGEVNEAPGASHLPVKLAVALLKDGNGVIDVDVPVSGSLDDPQFSLGGMVWRALAGMVAKAATAPFRLLASAFHGDGGGVAELGYIEYAPGADRLDDAAKAKLARIAEILAERPSLNLGIIGRTDPAFDQDGLRKVMVDELIRREYINDHGGSEESAPQTLSPEDTGRYLEAAYKHAEFPKERNLIGLTRSQSPEEMRRLLETNLTIDEGAMLHLAERRAGHVVGFLHGKVDDRRLWTLAPKLDAKGIDDKGGTTRVDFSLH